MNSNPSFLRIFSEARLWGDAQRRLATVAIFPRRIRARRTLLPLRSPCPSSASRDGTRLRNSRRRAYRATTEVRRRLSAHLQRVAQRTTVQSYRPSEDGGLGQAKRKLEGRRVAGD